MISSLVTDPNYNTHYSGVYNEIMSFTTLQPTYKARSSSSNATPSYLRVANHCKDQSTKFPPFRLNAF